MRRVDEDAAHFKRKATFKVFLTNPTMRSALFKPLRMGHESLPLLVETDKAVTGQAAAAALPVSEALRAHP
jgi:hypothetical protein